MTRDRDTGRHASPAALREAKRIAALHPSVQRTHPTAVPADHAQLAHINSYGALPEFYIDRPFVCRDCGREEIWRARDQKWFYEEAKGHIDAEAVRCHDCRKARRSMRKVTDTQAPVIAERSPGDLPALLDLFNAARASAEGMPSKPATRSGFEALLEGEDVLVAKLGDSLAGFVSVWREDNFVHHLYVAPNAQGRGIGTALLDACKARWGLPLRLKCLVANTGARAFYEKAGWLEEGHGWGRDGPWVSLRLGG